MSFATRVMQNCRSGGTARFLVMLIAECCDEFYPETVVCASATEWGRVMNVTKESADKAIINACDAGDLIRIEDGICLSPELVFSVYQKKTNAMADVLEARNVV